MSQNNLIQFLFQRQQTILLNFNNKPTVMLRRKNPEHIFLQPQTNHSPYRFERKNINLSPAHSPGLSPMRCRTPTRGNVSPFKFTHNNDNYRPHSPIKFVTQKTVHPVNQMTKGFFRAQSHTNYQAQYNQKYATSNTNNNDHSVKRQSFYQNPTNSKINYPPNENSERTMLHENNKLFSKLVEKINSQKKKQPQLVRRNTKPQIYKALQTCQVQVKTNSNIEKLTRQKSQTDHLKIEGINDHIKPVESVVYQERQARAYTYQNQVNNYTSNGKENKEIEHQHTYKMKQKTTEKTYSEASQVTNKNNAKFKQDQKSQMLTKGNLKPTTPSKKDEQVQREKSLKRQAQKQRIDIKNLPQNNTNKYKGVEQAKKEPKKEELDDFEQLDMLLGKIPSYSRPIPSSQSKQSIGNYSQASNVQNSINMDPYL